LHIFLLSLVIIIYHQRIHLYSKGILHTIYLFYWSNYCMP